MAVDRIRRRRWVGAWALTGALAMLIAGETVLKGRFGPTAFIAYWLGCLVLTCLAIFIALADARASQLRIRREQKDLVETTLKNLPLKGEEPAADPRPGQPERRRT